ncbi:hypothetical protein [Megasphaera elsdenii]|uniref:hypothetical protein n=1 Tax=Megasphaera elsdenii TaxID=907 RepID=UPI00242A3398|nr:hypothetical protein [Megasphaera elsdenii]
MSDGSAHFSGTCLHRLWLYGHAQVHRRLQWPKTPDEVRELTPQQYRWLMEGLSVGQPRAVQKITPKIIL